MNSSNLGRNAVLIVIAIILFVAALSILLQPDAPSVVRFFLTCILCWFLYKGRNWARWVFAILVVLAVVLVMFAVITIPMPPIGYVILGALISVYGGTLVALFHPKLGAPYFIKDAT